MTLLLDTHVILWILTESPRARHFDWLPRYRPWGVSPISLLEIQFLSEVGRVTVRNPDFSDRLANDSRFVLDEAPLLPLVHRALTLEWTRDPFDRLLAAHSTLRRVPLFTLDRRLRAHHKLLPRELET